MHNANHNKLSTSIHWHQTVKFGAFINQVDQHMFRGLVQQLLSNGRHVDVSDIMVYSLITLL